MNARKFLIPKHSFVFLWCLLFTVGGQITLVTNGAAATPPVKPAARLYFVGASDAPLLQRPSIRSTSIVQPQIVIAKLFNIPIEREYTAKWRCFDGAGKLVGEAGPFSFEPNSTNYGMYFSTGREIVPDHHLHKPGNWLWQLEIADYGVFTNRLEVLAASPDELAELALYEQARENVLTAFSEYWLGFRDKTFITTISHKTKIAPDIREQLSALESKERELRATIASLTNGPGNAPVGRYFGDGKYAKLKEAEMALSRVTAEKSSLEKNLTRQNSQPLSEQLLGTIQVSGITDVDDAFSSITITEADRLNGIAYKGKAEFLFTTFRLLKTEGWTDWQDAVNAPSIFPRIFGNWARATSPEFQKRMNLKYSVIQRDGNWIVTTAGGDQFINGKLTKADSEWINERPSPEFANEVVNGRRSFTRESFQSLGEATRSDTGKLESSRRLTMDLLRGRRLSR